MAHRVVDNLDALVGIAVKIAAARQHAIPIVFFRFAFYRFAADSGDRVVASYRGHGDLARPFAVLAYVSSGMELATALLRIYAALGQCFFPSLDPRAHFVRWMRMAHRHDVIAHAPRPFQSPRRSAGNPNRRMGLLHRPWVKRYLRKAPELTLVLETLAVPSLENDLQRFDHSLLPLLSLDTKDLIIQKRVAGPDTELQSAARNRIHHGVIFGALQWMAQRQDRDARPQANARRARCGSGQQHCWIGHESAVAEEMVLVEHETFPAQVLRKLDLLKNLLIVNVVETIQVGIISGQYVDVETHDESP